jgi:hypothetical protein
MMESASELELKILHSFERQIVPVLERFNFRSIDGSLMLITGELQLPYLGEKVWKP